MAEEEAQRTEPATPRRREQARQKGEVAQSREIQSVVVLGAAVLLMGSALGTGLAWRVAGLAREAWGGLGAPPATLGDFHAALLHHVASAGVALVPLVALLALAGAVSQVAQTGPLFSLEALEFKGSRLSPLQGAKRMFSPDRLFDLGKALVKIAVVGGIGWAVIASDVGALVGLAAGSIADGLRTAGLLGRRLAVATIGILAFLAVLDLFYQRWRYEKKLRMSKREVRDEMRQREGDPHMRNRFRQAQRELSRSRMIASVADAHVVITNPTHYAVALRYDRGAMAAPQVLAKGRNQVAERIRRAAREHRVPIVENPPLARLLHQKAVVGREIPENLFQAVAEVLAYVYRLDPRRGRSWRTAS